MYTLVFVPRAVKELQKNIKKKLETLASDPQALQNDIARIKGKIKGLYRLRVGNYRIIYRLENDRLLILIIRIGYRKNVYEGL